MRQGCLGMADPLAQAFADLPSSSESEAEEEDQSDAQSSEEELDSEEEEARKKVRCWLLDAGCWLLDAGWHLGAKAPAPVF